MPRSPEKHFKEGGGERLAFAGFLGLYRSAVDLGPEVTTIELLPISVARDNQLRHLRADLVNGDYIMVQLKRQMGAIPWHLSEAWMIHKNGGGRPVLWWRCRWDEHTERWTYVQGPPPE